VSPPGAGAGAGSLAQPASIPMTVSRASSRARVLFIWISSYVILDTNMPHTDFTIFFQKFNHLFLKLSIPDS
jgi:hypothetical protein